MRINHIHFYVKDATASRNWFVNQLGLPLVAHQTTCDSHTDILSNGAIDILLSSAPGTTGPVAQYLREHPSGVADVAFTVDNLTATMEQAIHQGARVCQPIQVEWQPAGCLKWAQIAGWGSLCHTLIERQGITSPLPHLGSPLRSIPLPSRTADSLADADPQLTAIDHLVLNVAAGDLKAAVTWYETVLGFQARQSFTIQTEYSGLDSQVLVHPEGPIQLPINQPATVTSQIQEFLDLNRGPGIQHIALQTPDILTTVSALRQVGLNFLSIPATYYEGLQQEYAQILAESDWEAISTCQVLVDRQCQTIPAFLLQTFTQPVFEQPTFFFELIERQTYTAGGQFRQVEGFGAGNFRALFEAIEREQHQRQAVKSIRTSL
ncbi:4-hydroxyphenylpyruvate dioxygenase [Leptolyngbya sp. 'hensonii']|uniref:4-hydroxyphenylpyruvate dioxygenase n=1 Tax=Leptolyngbya sp. 'hensonii' TaxID=1922337 RepID=UPI00094F8AAE|nr:4-hydroxyphenylpyruvate dioxygenase [Leptolyngbya sp. 'hensonii']OLP18964.1 4-hydroxyphenylpyruvate dioxygenase [Leptolyngbya sp. 'hensonii']